MWDGSQLVVTELDVRDPGPGEVQVRVLASGICHSDLNVMEGMRGPKPPVVVGHEAAGVVHRLGDGVTNVAEGTHNSRAQLGPNWRARRRQARPTGSARWGPLFTSL